MESRNASVNQTDAHLTYASADSTGRLNPDQRGQLNAEPNGHTDAEPAGQTTTTDQAHSLSPNTSKLPVIERKPDHLNTIVTTLCVVTFLPLPLLLAFGPKSFLWMGILICIAAVIRLINSPVQLQRPAPPVNDSVSAASRQSQAIRTNGASSTIGSRPR